MSAPAAARSGPRQEPPSGAGRVGPAETAFGHRDARYAMIIGAFWSDPTDDEANIGWVRDYYDAVHPYSGTEGGYVNFMSADDAARAALDDLHAHDGASRRP